MKLFRDYYGNRIKKICRKNYIYKSKGPEII